MHGGGVAEVLARADQLLYRAKQQGRNRVVSGTALEDETAKDEAAVVA